MPARPSPNPLLAQALLRDAKEASGALFLLMEQSLNIDAEDDIQAEAGKVLDAQIAELAPRAETLLRNLRNEIDPWPARRGEYPPELAQEIDHFFSLQDKGLAALKGQLDHLTREAEQSLTDLGEEMRKLQCRKQGLQGYKGRTITPEMLNKKV